MQNIRDYDLFISVGSVIETATATAVVFKHRTAPPPRCCTSVLCTVFAKSYHCIYYFNKFVFTDYSEIYLQTWPTANLIDNPHTHYTLTNAAAAAVQMTDGALKYDWRRRLNHMQMIDSDFTLNDWRRRLGGGGAVLYFTSQRDVVRRSRWTLNIYFSRCVSACCVFAKS